MQLSRPAARVTLRRGVVTMVLLEEEERGCDVTVEGGGDPVDETAMSA